MNERKLSERPRLLLIALGITVGALIAGNSAADIAIGEVPGGGYGFGFIDAWDVAILHLLLTGLPFYVLAARRDGRLPMWLTAAVLTVASWAYFVWMLRQDYLAGFAGGANMMLGFLMMAAPFAILILLKTLSFLLRTMAH